MHTSFALLTLVSALTHNAAFSTAWTDDYYAARQLGERSRKPLAVFAGHGAFDWKQLTREGKPDPAVQRLLSDRYVRVYLDLNTAAGKKLAAAFGLADRGVVISDRTGDVQAFRHDGDLAATDLAARLERYADPELAVKTTESVAPPAAAPAVTPVNYVPQLYAQPFGGACRT